MTSVDYAKRNATGFSEDYHQYYNFLIFKLLFDAILDLSIVNRLIYDCNGNKIF